MGYNCAPQMSTRISPYELLFARRPFTPPSMRGKLDTPLNITIQQEAEMHERVVLDVLQRLNG
jgi:hypothetical protein